MKKEEILKKSREENKNGDERELKIQEHSESNAYNLILGIFALLTLICYILRYFKGYFVVNPDYFLLAILVGLCSKSITEYSYDKKKKGNLIFCILVGLSILIKIGTIFGAM